MWKVKAYKITNLQTTGKWFDVSIIRLTQGMIT